MSELLSIGAVAKRAGVSVQTLRHYDAIGLLRPSHVAANGYRRYSALDCARLDLIRTLRGVGFDLDTITRLMKREMPPKQAVQIQMDALAVQLRMLQRQQTILKAVAAGDEGAVLSRLQRLQVLAKLDQFEREAFLSGQLAPIFEGKPINPEVWRAAVADLPTEMNEAQLEAWLELAEIVADADFQQTLQRQMQPIGDGALSHEAEAALRQTMHTVMGEAIAAVQAQQTSDAAASQATLMRWVEGWASIMGRMPDQAFVAWLSGYFQSTSHPKIDRYWQLISQLKSLPYNPIYGQAMAWLMSGLSLLQMQR